METVGAYAFITKDWKEKDFPLDLWLKWHLKLFDKVSLVTYGKFDVPYRNNPKLILGTMAPVSRKTFKFYTMGKLAAQHQLDTDWKMILDVDEFIAKPINVVGLDKRKAYAIRMHPLYGNPYTELFSPTKRFENKFVLHYGDRDITNASAGAGVVPPYAARPLIINSIRDALVKILGTGRPAFRFKPSVYFEIFHTSSLRNPKALSAKLREEVKREMNEGVHLSAYTLKYLNEDFDYRDFKRLYPGCYLQRIDKAKLPKIIIENEKRFYWADFSKKDYRKPIFASVAEFFGLI